MLSEVISVSVALAVVLISAALILRLLRGRTNFAGRMQVIDRVALDGKNALYLVRVKDMPDAEALLLGVGDHGAPNVLARISKVSAVEPSAPTSFRTLLARYKKPVQQDSTPKDNA